MEMHLNKKENNQSTLLLRNVTCIDHAFLDTDESIKGGSFHPEITVTGEIEDEEQVVVDFSKVKSQIKNCIDSKENGYDHKLWVIQGYSNMIDFDYTRYVIENTDERYYNIRTSKLEISIPSNAVRYIENPNGYRNLKDIVAHSMANDLQEMLNSENNGNFKVTVELTTHVFGSSPKLFTYWHGLKNSTSWGCKNIAHGHTSFVEAYNEDGYRIGDLERMIAHYLDGALLINKENMTTKNNLGYVVDRGAFQLSFSPSVKHIIMDKETTIENIVDHVCEVFHATLDFYNVKKLFISEGLQKGALKVISNYHT